MHKSVIKYLLCFALIFCAFLCSKFVLFAISLLFIFLAMKEYRNVIKNRNVNVYKYFPEIICSFYAYLFIFNENLLEKTAILLLIGSLIISFLMTIIKNQKPYIETTFYTFMLIFFVFSGLYTIKLYEMQPTAIIITYFASVLLSDYCASIAGLKIKKRIPLAKEISPNKTVGGFFAHVITSCIIFTVASGYIGINPVKSAILGVLVSFSSQIGDLSISCIKRDCGIKHSSLLFGEYGGILDRMDAFIFSAPVAYYCLTRFIG